MPKEKIQDPVFREAVGLLDAGDVDGLRMHLAAHPEVVKQRIPLGGSGYFSNPTLLEFAAENPIRQGRLPDNIIDVVRVIIEAGGKSSVSSIDSTLGLVSSGRVPRECGLQIPLIGLLCDYGADPDRAMLPALVHGEFEAVNALINRGASVTLAVAAALGRVKETRELLPDATAEERHKALAFAAQHGHAEIVRDLLDAGEDPNRFNPAGTHAHSTPLHQAVVYGHSEVVQLLVERGAHLDVKDLFFGGTPLGWAIHARDSKTEAYLRVKGAEL